MRSNTIVGSACLISLLATVACSPSQSLDAAAKEPDQPALEMQAAAQPEAMAVEAPQTAKAIQPKSPAAKAAKPAAAPKTVAANMTAQQQADATPPPAMETPVMESRAESRPVATRQQDEESIATTIGGCLIRDDGMFKLKDTDGDHAPKSRSWKSGFIKKNSARIELVDAGQRVDFKSHVGYRVNVSGMLVDREMQVRAIKGGTERCD
jgi:hypothetical protein